MPRLKVDHNHKTSTIKQKPNFLLAVKTAIISLSMAVFSGSAIRAQAIDKTIDSSSGITEELPEEELAKIQKNVEEELENLPLEPSSLEENEDVHEQETDSKKMSIVDFLDKTDSQYKGKSFLELTLEDIKQIDLTSISLLKNLEHLSIEGYTHVIPIEDIKQILESTSSETYIYIDHVTLDFDDVNNMDLSWLNDSKVNFGGMIRIEIPGEDKKAEIAIDHNGESVADFKSLESHSIDIALQNLSCIKKISNLQLSGDNFSIDNLKNLNEQFRSKTTSSLSVSADSISLDTLNFLNKTIQNLTDIDIENIPIDYMKYLSDETLSKIKNLKINIDNINPNETFEFLEKCTALSEFDISYIDENGKNVSSQLYSAKEKSYSVKTLDKVDLDSNAILKALKGKDIEKVYIGYSGSISVETLKELKQLKHLDIGSFDDYSVTGDISELGFLEDISIPSQTRPYDLALGITGADIESLRNQGVTVNISAEQEEKLFEIDAKLEKMVQELRLPHDASDEEKMLAITKYVVNHCEYDSEFSGASEDEKDELREKKGYYKEGHLYGALEGTEHICGNFAALTQALAKRVGLESYKIGSLTHAYNLVNLDGYYYYMDTTFLDYMEERYVLESGDQELIDKLYEYKMNPLDYEGMGEKDDPHLTTNLPPNITLNEKNTKSLKKENALLMYGKMHSKEIISALVGIGCAIGAGIYIGKSRREIKNLKSNLRLQNETVESQSKEIAELKAELKKAYKYLEITQKDLFAVKQMMAQSKNKGEEEPKKEEGMSINGD